MKTNSSKSIQFSLLLLLIAQFGNAQNVNDAVHRSIDDFENNINSLINDADRAIDARRLLTDRIFKQKESSTFNFLEEHSNNYQGLENIPIDNLTSLLLQDDYDGTTVLTERIKRRIDKERLKGNSQIRASVIMTLNLSYRGRRFPPRPFSLVYYFSYYEDSRGLIKDLKIDAIVQQADGDFDTFCDEDDGTYKAEDECPNAPSFFYGGCPDTDGDGVIDKEDRCVNIRGNKPTGCPDADNDGILNDDDECPNLFGFRACKGCPDKDEDKICDIIEDKCPDEKGPSKTNGCPDKDGDGVPDKDDACVSEYGEKNLEMADCNGCPDTDKDRLCDRLDKCPNEKGPIENGGCPDRDDDGIIDKEDRCPNIKGERSVRYDECNGCPDGDRDGVCDIIDKCPGTEQNSNVLPLERGDKNYDRCLGCPDDDKDYFCNEIDDCRYTAGKGNNNGCPPKEPIGRFDIDLTAGGWFPTKEFTENGFYNQIDNTWNTSSGLANIGWGADFSINYNLKHFVGVGIGGGRIGIPINTSAMNSNIKIALITNNIEYKTVDITSNAYEYYYLAGKIRLGYFRESSRLVAKLEPSFGVFYGGSSNNKIDAIITHASSPVDRALFDLKSQSNSLGYIKTDFSIYYNISEESNLFVGIKGAYLKKTVKVVPQEISLNSTLPTVSLKELSISAFSIAFTANLFF
ncbi:MAG: hypothetical protein IT258_16640 [Saprospiraceae bacterium]|nr:hypothetical protein [Saprospiraceae bacterium]